MDALITIVAFAAVGLWLSRALWRFIHRHSAGWIYVIADGTHVKIGWTAGNPRRRLRQLQTGNPRRLRLIGAVSGTMVEEKALHARFTDSRVEGEWFAVEPGVLAALDRGFGGRVGRWMR